MNEWVTADPWRCSPPRAASMHGEPHAITDSYTCR